MGHEDLLLQWLIEARDDLEKQAREAESSHGALRIKSTTYARAIRTMADAHLEAARVYHDLIGQWHDDNEPCDGCHRAPCDCDRQYDEWKDRQYDE